MSFVSERLFPAVTVEPCNVACPITGTVPGTEGAERIASIGTQSCCAATGPIDLIPVAMAWNLRKQQRVPQYYLCLSPCELEANYSAAGIVLGCS